MAGARTSWRRRASALSSSASSSREGMLLNSASVGRSLSSFDLKLMFM